MAREPLIGLDLNLQRAWSRGNTGFIEQITGLRLMLNDAARHEDWKEYNKAAVRLNTHGARIPLKVIPKEQQPEQLIMGMFDKPQYLTGKDGYVEVGDTFWLHNARLDGTTVLQGKEKDQVKLLVSKERDSEQVVVYTSGAAIVRQIKTMDARDRQNLPMELRLDEMPSKQGNMTKVMTPAGSPPPSTDDMVGAGNGDNDF